MQQSGYHRYDEWMKPDTKTTIIWFHLCDVQEQAKLINDGRSQNSSYLLAEGGVRGGWMLVLTVKVHREPSSVAEMFYSVCVCVSI